MPALLSLPNELLIAILLSSTSVQSAARLSIANRRLQGIWSENVETITSGILERDIDGFPEAVDLAVIETKASSRSDVDHETGRLSISAGNAQLSLSLLLPKLNSNLQLASIVCVDFRASLGKAPTDVMKRALASVTLPLAYYLLRQIVHAFHQRQLRPTLCAKLQQAPEDLLHVMEGICFYLCEESDWKERIRHGIPKNRSEWEYFDELVANANVDEWTFAGDVVGTALMDKRLCRPPHTYILIEGFDPLRRQEHR